MSESFLLTEPGRRDYDKLRFLLATARPKEKEISCAIAPVFGRLTLSYGVSTLLCAGGAGNNAGGRKHLFINNTSETPIVVGANSTAEIYELGLTVDPGEHLTINFENDTAISWYARALGDSATVEVGEW